MFAVTAEKKSTLRETGDNFYCPNGHAQHYTESTEQKHKKEVDRLNRLIATKEGRQQWALDQLGASERSNSALRGAVTRKKNQLNKVKNGVCPCCNRFFKNLHRHMAGQHPDFQE